jgi:hypothetical protein
MLRVTIEAVPGGVEGDAKTVAKLEAANVTRDPEGRQIPQREDGRADYELTFVDSDGGVELLRLPNVKRGIPPWVFVREAIFAFTTHREQVAQAALEAGRLKGNDDQ